MNNWLQAQKIILNGEKLLDRILLEYVDERGCMLAGSQRNGQIQGWIPFEEKYFRTKFLPLTLEITKDMKQAKEFLGLNTKVEDLIQELNK